MLFFYFFEKPCTLCSAEIILIIPTAVTIIQFLIKYACYNTSLSLQGDKGPPGTPGPPVSFE